MPWGSEVLRFRTGNRPGSGALLDSCSDLRRRGAAEVDWGHAGSGAAQLALALLMDYLSNEAEAVRLHRHFTEVVVAHLPAQEWTLTDAEVREALESVRARQSAAMEFMKRHAPVEGER